jgi:hypothetical protein
MAASTLRSRARFTTPSTAMVTNHTSVTGPKILPTVAVPRLCMAKSATRMTMVMGMMYGSKRGVATSSPSTALSTEITGVIIPSPYSSAVPNSPSITSTQRGLRLSAPTGVTSEVSARMPPSPRLSARRTKTAYLTEMTSASAQKMSDSTPSTLSRVTPMPCAW